VAGRGGDGAWDFDDVERWAAAARATDAADGRVRERGLRRQAQEEAAFVGTLLDLVERGRSVVVVTAGGRQLVGRLEALGADFVALRTGGRTTLVALDAVGAVRPVRPEPGTAQGGWATPAAEGRAGGPPAASTTRVADVLAHAVERRPRIQVHVGPVPVVGELRSVGTDVISVEVDGDPPALTYVRLASVSEISLLDSG
jgi:hypothetical protein